MNKFTRDVRQAKPDTKRAGFYTAEPEPFEVTYTPTRGGTFNIYLLDIIETPRQFLNAIEVLQAASEDDTVVIHLQTGGGSLDATDMFIQAMRECEGTIIVKASGGVHSAGTIILLEADQFTLSENFNCLIHNGSCGSGGKFSDFKTEAQFTQAHMERVMHSTYKGFLTNDEILALLDGKDYWFFAEEFAARFEARNTLLQAEYEAEQAALLALVTQDD
jgi:ATP-dependent protease ClpP protease subunit